jgi:hypothetical protein
VRTAILVVCKVGPLAHEMCSVHHPDGGKRDRIPASQMRVLDVKSGVSARPMPLRDPNSSFALEFESTVDRGSKSQEE